MSANANMNTNTNANMATAPSAQPGTRQPQPGYAPQPVMGSRQAMPAYQTGPASSRFQVTSMASAMTAKANRLDARGNVISPQTRVIVCRRLSVNAGGPARAAGFLFGFLFSSVCGGDSYRDEPATAIYIDADACPVKAEIYRSPSDTV